MAFGGALSIQRIELRRGATIVRIILSPGTFDTVRARRDPDIRGRLEWFEQQCIHQGHLSPLSSALLALMLLMTLQNFDSNRRLSGPQTPHARIYPQAPPPSQEQF